MRLITCFTFLFALSASTVGQSFSTSPGDTISSQITSGVYHVATIDLYPDSTSNDSIQFKWEVLYESFPASWDFSYCDYPNCYTGDVEFGTMNSISNSQTAYFKVNVLPTTVDTASVVVRVYNAQDQQDERILVYHYNAVLGMDEAVSFSNVQIFPNPSLDKNAVKISNLVKDTEIQLVNGLGQQVLVDRVSTGSTTYTLDRSHLKKGVYFVHLVHNNGSYSTRKLILR